MLEGAIMRRCMLALSGAACAVFRANVGSGWTSSSPPVRALTHPITVTLMPGDVLLRQARPFSSGLPTGFSDLFGFRPDGRAFFVEAKSATGRVRPDQDAFLSAMRSRGAVAVVTRSADDVVAQVLG